VADDKQF